MESLSDTKWDVVISGTGLQQSLLALALSRSDKKIIHLDPNEYYGATEAAFSLQEAEDWAARHADDGTSIFARAQVIRDEGSQGLGSSRAYSLALAPQVIHTKSQLLSQLVTSKAFRQIEFLAVGSFYILQPADSGSDAPPSLSRIPSTREDVFANTAIPARAKRHLMKFLKFVLGHEETPQVDQWRPQANKPLTEFLASAFNLDAALQSYVVALTLSIDGKISVEAGLKAIHKHISSMGLFGPGFAAVYPKWGGLSEVAQVGCRAGAVGGAVYMLGTGITTVASAVQESIPPLTITLTNDVVINAKTLVQESVTFSDNGQRLSKMIAIVNAALLPVFEVVVEGAPTPAVAIVAIPPGSVVSNGSASEYPVYLAIHSSDTGECPAGQCILYLSTRTTPTSKDILEAGLSSLLQALSQDQLTPKSLFQMFYEQRDTSPAVNVEGSVVHLPSLGPDLAFHDSVMDQVRVAWDAVVKSDETVDRSSYMKFEDREGADPEEDIFD